MKKHRIKEVYICVIFIDLSKVFDTLTHNLLIVKLRAYGFDTKALYYAKDYLDSRKQRVRVNSNLVLGKKLLLGYRKVPF